MANNKNMKNESFSEVFSGFVDKAITMSKDPDGLKKLDEFAKTPVLTNGKGSGADFVNRMKQILGKDTITFDDMWIELEKGVKGAFTDPFIGEMVVELLGKNAADIVPAQARNTFIAKVGVSFLNQPAYKVLDKFKYFIKGLLLIYPQFKPMYSVYEFHRNKLPR